MVFNRRWDLIPDHHRGHRRRLRIQSPPNTPRHLQSLRPPKQRHPPTPLTTFTTGPGTKSTKTAGTTSTS